MELWIVWGQGTEKNNWCEGGESNEEREKCCDTIHNLYSLPYLEEMKSKKRFIKLQSVTLKGMNEKIKSGRILDVGQDVYCIQLTQ